MKNAVVILVLLACFSCETSSNDAVVVDIRIDMTIEDRQGNDLLNPETENSIQQDDIRVYYEIDGKKETYLSCHKDKNVILDNPAGFLIYPEDALGKFQLSVFSNPTQGEAITIIELEGHDDVTLKAQVSRENGNTIVRKVWYQGNLVWPTETNNGPAYVQVVLD